MSVLLAVAGELETDILVHLSQARPPIAVARRCADRAEMLGAAQAGLGTVAVVEDADMAFIRELHACGVRVLGVGAAGQARARGFDAVCSPYGSEVKACVLQLMAAPVPELVEVEVAEREPGRLVAVWGTAGSPGRSCLARDLAAAFAGGPTRRRRLFRRRRGQAAGAGASDSTQPARPRVLLLDADTHAPSLAQMLSLDQESSAIAAVARKIGLGEASAELLEGACVPVAGFDFLAGLNRAQRWRELPEPVVRELYAQAVLGWDVVVADCAAGAERSQDGYGLERDAATLELLEAADSVVVLGKASPVGVRRLLDRIDEAESMGIERIHVVLSRTRTARVGSETESAVERLLAVRNVTDAVWLGEDISRYEDAERQGLALAEAAPGSEAVRAVEALAAAISASWHSEANGESPEGAEAAAPFGGARLLRAGA